MGINDSWTNGGIRMRLEDGSLYRRPMDQDLWEFYDFNRIYEGFYPACLRPLSFQGENLYNTSDDVLIRYYDSFLEVYERTTD